jgi:hypothetical protein
MKALTRACLLALPFLAGASVAQAACPSFQVQAGFGCNINSPGTQCKPMAGPWYTYFPYNAYFQTPAPVYGWPYLPSQAAQPVPAPQSNAGPRIPQKPQTQEGYHPAPSDVQTVGYVAPAPSYWYGR